MDLKIKKLSNLLYDFGYNLKKYNTLCLDTNTYIIDINDKIKINKKLKNKDKIENMILEKDARVIYDGIGFFIDIFPDLKRIFIGKTDDFNYNKIGNLTGIIIDYEYLKKIFNNSILQFTFEKYNNALNQLNIIFNNKFNYSIDIPEKLTDFQIFVQDDETKIYISNEQNDIEYEKQYIIDKNQNIKKINHSIKLYKSIVYDFIDLKELASYEKINAGIIDTNKLIIDAPSINKSYKINNNTINAKYVEITDNNDMKLIPDNKIIEIGQEFDVVTTNEKISLVCNTNHNYNHYYIFDKETKIIDIDKNANVSVIDYDYLNQNFKDIEEIYYSFNDRDYAILIKHKKRLNYTVINKEHKIYKINKSLGHFIVLDAKDDYKHVKYKKLDDYLKHDICYIGEDIEDIYKAYIEYMDKLKKLNKLGVDRRVLYYLLCDESTNFDGIRNLVGKGDLTQNEINQINLFGKTLIKKFNSKK